MRHGASSRPQSVQHRVSASGTPDSAAKRRGLFITFEGCDGAGKSTAAAHVKRVLEARGVGVRATREPGGTPLGERVRAALRSTDIGDILPMSETLLLLAARAQHVADVIEPELASGRWVVCDRFADSTRAYQVAGRGVSGYVVEMLAEQTHGGCVPDLTFYLDVPVRKGLDRVIERERCAGGKEPDRIEREPEIFHQRVRAAYRRLAGQYRRIVTVDAAGSIDEVLRRVSRELTPLVLKWERAAAQEG